MQKFYIRAERVEQGMFSDERIVSLQVDGSAITLIVDRGDIRRDDQLRVNVLQQQGKRSLIDLPREPVTGSTRLVVPSEMLHQE